MTYVLHQIRALKRVVKDNLSRKIWKKAFQETKYLEPPSEEEDLNYFEQRLGEKELHISDIEFDSEAEKPRQ